MARFIGEYPCKVDGKGRFIVPAKLKKQLPPEAQSVLVITRGFDKSLVLYTRADWDAEVDKNTDNLDFNNRQNRQFIRNFHNGANEVPLDGSDRILIPKRLMEYAEIKNDVILYAFRNRIEIWAEHNYETETNMDSDSYASLAEQVAASSARNGSTSAS